MRQVGHIKDLYFILRAGKAIGMSEAREVIWSNLGF